MSYSNEFIVSLKLNWSWHSNDQQTIIVLNTKSNPKDKNILKIPTGQRSQVQIWTTTWFQDQMWDLKMNEFPYYSAEWNSTQMLWLLSILIDAINDKHMMHRNSYYC